MESFGLLINGKWKTTNEMIDVLDKTNQDVYAKVVKASHDDVNQAVDAAEQAFQNDQTTPYERYEILMKVANLLKENKEELAQNITHEAGKPIKQARSEVDRAVQTTILSAEEAKRLTGEGVPVETAPGSENRMAFTIRVPVGVVAAISPFNFPLNLVMHKIGPAIAAGNTVVLKPASATPTTALKLAEIFQKAGLPDGVLNVVTGKGSEIGKWLTQDERIQLFTFTGSAEVGLNIKQNTGMKKLVMELGNNSPVIVDHETDIQEAAQVIAVKSYAYAGQVCISVQRVYVHESIRDEFVKELIHAMSDLNVGDPFDDATDVGPMISIDEAKRAEEWIEEANAKGAKVVQGGTRKENLLEPTIVTNVTEEMKVVCEEVFAPILSLIPYNDLDQCLEDVNQSKYGLQGGIFTKNIDKAMKAARKMEVGGFMINDASQYRVDLMPYGGMKDSGWGKEGPKYSIEEMTEERLIVMNLK
ncbi:aldehyde dehydrogenase family protein [Aquisalibacillus elongatus]|uniref:Acyl-CoA reductase-like NAD-dependent aldehyde dehydrogenase n=1 Tax=Aquisalibacillus elongatus TaxID=485577 RepID=A0A3N5BRH6_9BACI|nr:aldehyde dehydrogenase family protein [Aquisalibacillus elongatus]RPF50112.1 acyl-CoA reductase-like NAD-dependent aldehyde dehydrogenase [Aquisalibacillus elongatus]